MVFGTSIPGLQKFNLRANCPIRGSRALRMAPKPPALTVLTGPLKFERLKKLKKSARKLAVKPSRMVNAFDTPKSVLNSPGPRKAPFERFPYVPSAGSAKADGSSLSTHGA